MRTILFIALTCCVLACGKNMSKEQKALDATLEAYNNSPDDNTSKAFASAYNDYTDKHGFSDPAISSYMLAGARLAEKRQKLNPALSWYESYFINFQDDPDVADHFYEMVSLIEAIGKPDLSQVFYKSLIHRFPSHPQAESIKAKISDPSLSIDSTLQLVLQSIPKALPDEPTNENIPLHPEHLQLYIEMVEVSVMTDTSLALGPEHLVKAAEMARIGKLYQRSIKLYGWIGRLYPTHPYRTSGIFMKGYVTYFDLKNYPAANEFFKEYQKQDPYGQFEVQANYLLNNPGKTEEEFQKAMGAE